MSNSTLFTVNGPHYCTDKLRGRTIKVIGSVPAKIHAHAFPCLLYGGCTPQDGVLVLFPAIFIFGTFSHVSLISLSKN